MLLWQKKLLRQGLRGLALTHPLMYLCTNSSCLKTSDMDPTFQTLQVHRPISGNSHISSRHLIYNCLSSFRPTPNPRRAFVHEIRGTLPEEASNKKAHATTFVGEKCGCDECKHRDVTKRTCATAWWLAKRTVVRR